MWRENIHNYSAIWSYNEMYGTYLWNTSGMCPRSVILCLLYTYNAQVYIIHDLPILWRYQTNGMFCMANLTLVHVYNILLISDANICELPAKQGPCRGYFPRYFFNSQTGECEKFIYGGCRGNENNFQHLEECRLACDCKSVR